MPGAHPFTARAEDDMFDSQRKGGLPTAPGEREFIARNINNGERGRAIAWENEKIEKFDAVPRGERGERNERRFSAVRSEKSDRNSSPRTSWNAPAQTVQTPKQPAGPKGMFADADAMKENVRKHLAKETYDVSNFYKTEGIWQMIARHHYFEYVTLSVILLNAIWIAVDTDLNDSETLLDAKVQFIIVENLFCIYFSAEWFIRFAAFEKKINGLRDCWFVFDSCLVFSMVIETWVMAPVIKLAGSGSGGGLGNASILRMARLLRLSRMARMVRLLRAVPELMILLKGIVAAGRSVIFTLMLLLFFTYIFAILFAQISEDHEGLLPFFNGVMPSIYSLVMHGVFLEDLKVMVDLLMTESAFLTLVFVIFVLVAALTVMNMLIGVLCEVVSAVATTEKEALEVAFVKSKLQQVLLTSFPYKAGQEAHELNVTKAEYEQVLENQAAARLLQEVGVDVVGLVDLTDLFFEEETRSDESGAKTLSFADLMESVLELRGTNGATVKDIMSLRKFVRQTLDARLERMERALQGLEKRRISSPNAVILGGAESPLHFGKEGLAHWRSEEAPPPSYPLPPALNTPKGYPPALTSLRGEAFYCGSPRSVVPPSPRGTSLPLREVLARLPLPRD